MSEKLPSKAELTVLSADQPNQKKLNWVVQEYLGGEVFKARPGVAEVKHLGDIDTDRRLKSRDDLKPGDMIFVTSLWGGLMRAEVKQDNAGQLYAEEGRLVILLAFATDDRECWTTSGYINKRCVGKLLSTDQP